MLKLCIGELWLLLNWGKRDWARLDLWMALDVDPTNKEVMKKLDELKDTPNKRNLADEPHTVIPSGLGLSLSPPKKKKSQNLIQNMNQEGVSRLESCQIHEDQQLTVKNSNDVQEYGGDDNTMATHHEQDEEELQEQGSKATDPAEGRGEVSVDNCLQSCIKKIMEGKMEDANESLSTIELSSTITQEVDTCQKDDVKYSNPTEPKLRFKSRKRQGSLLTLSSSDYLTLRQGKILKFYNAKLGSLMEVKILNRSDRQASKKGDIQHQEKVDTMQSEAQVEQDITEDVHSETGSCVTSMFDCQNSVEDGDECSSQTIKHPTFSFSAKPQNTIRKFYGAKMKTRDSPASPLMRMKGRKMLDHRSNYPFPTNFYGCRYTSERKRKAEYQNIVQRTKKQQFFSSPCIVGSSCTVSKSCFSFVHFCTNENLEVQGRSQQLASDTFESACS